MDSGQGQSAGKGVGWSITPRNSGKDRKTFLERARPRGVDWLGRISGTEKRRGREIGSLGGEAYGRLERRS